MNTYAALVFLISLSAVFSYINHRFLKFPFVIGIFILSTFLSILIISAKFWTNIPFAEIKTAVENAQIDKVVLHILLGFLLFAGSLHTKWDDIKQQIKSIATFALGGVLISTLLIAATFYFVSQLLQVELAFIYCLLFGALISPTDPIAVLGILTKAKVPKKIESTIIGESLFNDGVGVVVFIALLETLSTGSFSLSHFGIFFYKKQLAVFSLDCY